MRLSIFVALALTTGPASAHEFWIAPADYTLTADQPLVAELRVGEGFVGDTFPYLPPRFTRFDVIASDEVLPMPGRMGDSPAVNVAGLPSGLLVLAYVSTASTVTYTDAETYDRFLREEGLDFAVARNAARGLEPVGLTERFTRHAKSLVAVGEGAGQDRRLGLKVEIVAGANPYTDDTSDGLPVQAFRDDAPFANMLLRVLARGPDGSVTETRLITDDEGRTTIPAMPGATLLANIVALDEETGAAQWHSHWASLTFAMPE